MRLTQLLSETPHRPKRLGLAVAAALALATPLALAQGSLIRGAGALPTEAVPYSHAVLDKAKLTSAFGMRKHPVSGELKQHQGVDLAEEEGKPIYAPTSAIVTRAEMTRGYGNLVEIAAGETVLRFGQLKDIEVSLGESVSAGTVIGSLGQSGQATGPHLHLEVWHAGQAVDPMAEPGLVLADSLFIAANSGAKVPQPPAAPAPKAAPEPASIPAAPLAPIKRDVAFEEIRGEVGGCEVIANWADTREKSAVWVARLEASQAQNRLAGLWLKADWTPESVTYPRPTYPADAAKKRLSGGCMVLFDLGVDGVPQNMLAECTDPVFESSAAELKGATFKPLTNQAGKPVDVKGITYPMEFCIA